MDLFSLIVGFVIGAVLAGVIVWLIGLNRPNAQSQKLTATENEIKQLISQQAKQHIDTTKSAVENMQAQLAAIQEQLAGFETGLLSQNTEHANQTFYGEHASLFLRNNPNKKQRDENKSSAGNPPRDFSSQGSGLFVGNIAEDAEKSK